VGQSATETIRVGAPPSTVYGIVVDFASYPSWANDLKSVVVTASDDTGRASEVEFRAAAFGRSTTYVLRYDYSDAPNSISWSQVRGDVTTKLEGRYTFSADGDGTLVKYELEVEMLFPIPGFIKSRAASRIQTQALRELKAQAERLA
jgi:ribosome-associated toxin RatA of RatAB toxin-antitoxin module